MERRFLSSPISVGETYDVEIKDRGKEGDGIARIEGFVVFVPGTEVGDKVKVKIKTVKRSFAIAEVVE